MAVVDVLKFGATPETMTAVSRRPTEMKQSVQDVDSQSTTRSASGKMVRSVVRGGDNAVRKLELKWEMLPMADVQSILDAVKEPFVYVQYMDALTGALRTARFYAGDRALEYRRIDKEDGSIFCAELTFNLIEE